MKALFLDRDGVIVEYVPYLGKVEDVIIPQGAVEALRKWQEADYQLVIVTNQSGISRGYFSREDVDLIHQKIRNEYAKGGVKFTDILLCPHQPKDNCICRKPSPYLIKQYAQEFNIILEKSFFIGDADSDLECAINAKCHPILILTGRGKDTLQSMNKYSIPITIINNLEESTQIIKK